MRQPIFLVSRESRFRQMAHTHTHTEYESSASKDILFLKMGQIRPLFVYFRPFLNTITNIAQNLATCKWNKCRWCAWDLTPGLQDGRRRRIH